MRRRKSPAALMHTSRAQVDRILDPGRGNVTIEALQRAAARVGRQFISSWPDSAIYHPGRSFQVEGFRAAIGESPVTYSSPFKPIRRTL